MFTNRIRLAGIATAAALIAAPLSWAQITPYSEDFEGLDQMSGTALGDAGWLVFANVFASDGTTFAYNYGAFPAPNGTGAFSNVTVGEGGPDQGAQGLVTFSDYNNGDHTNGSGNVLETLVFQERTLVAADAGTWIFQFDAKDGDLAGASTATAFVKTLDPNAGFFTTSSASIDTTALSSTWGTYTLAVNISAAQAGQILQIGFSTRASGGESSGVNYDNVSLDRFAGGIDAVVSEDFEALDQMSGTALGDAGWLVFANVFASDGTTFAYNYGAFPAPNGTGGFSNVTAGEGGPDQGAQGLVTFSDYNNGDHTNGSGNVLETLVFQELTLVAADAGTWIFEFDAKDGDLAGASTAEAFVKTLDPNAGFFTTSSATVDMTVLPSTWGTFTLAANIDAGQAGQILQIGFQTRASGGESSGVNYDNVEFGKLATVVDSDGDGVGDDVDNCTNAANANQRDTNGDGFGNACDTDLNNDCITNPIDLGLFKSVFFTTDADADFNGDGVVNPIDLGIFKAGFFLPPGPNASGTCP